jgi:hypothetical protein
MSAELNEAFDIEFAKSEAAPRKLGAITDWFMEKVKNVLVEKTLTGLSKEDFLAAVGLAYDKFVLPIDLPGPDSILDPLLKQLIMALSGRLYDKLKPA